MPVFKDLAGQRFGRWTVTDQYRRVKSPTAKYYHYEWLCHCDCGTEKWILPSNLTNGISKSCGCLKSEKAKEPKPSLMTDLSGQKIGRLTVTSTYESRKSGKSTRIYWLCKCSCGNEVWVSAGNLASGNVQSCGCLAKELTIQRSKRENTFEHVSDGYVCGYDSNGECFLFDECDFDKVNKYCWHVSHEGYVKTNMPKSNDKKRRLVVLHRYLLDMLDEDFSWNKVVDHINGDPRDNRRSNLRIATQKENSQNTGPYRNSKIGVPGVTKCSNCPGYIVRATYNGKRIYGGYFRDLDEAKKKAVELHDKYYGEFSYENSRNMKEFN